jgi:hypothetical protein
MARMLFRPGGIVAAACALLTLGITSCTGKPTPLNTSSAVTSPSASASPTPSPSQTSLYPSDVPLTGKNLTKVGEKPPIYPDAARANTQAGALAFAKFFLQTIDWGFATTSGAYMRHYAAQSCGLCSGIGDGLDKTAAAGHLYLGGRFTNYRAETVPKGEVSAPVDSCARVTVDIPAVSVTDSRGHVVNGQQALKDQPFKLCVKRKAASWTVTYLIGAA